MSGEVHWQEVVRNLHFVADCISYYERTTDLPDCNTCGRRDCRYKPKLGETVRINCPLWEEEGKE